MRIEDNIKYLWSTKCLTETRQKIIIALAQDGRLKYNTLQSVQQKYLYGSNIQIDEHEAPIVLETIVNALRAQNESINEKIRESEQV